MCDFKAAPVSTEQVKLFNERLSAIVGFYVESLCVAANPMGIMTWNNVLAIVPAFDLTFQQTHICFLYMLGSELIAEGAGFKQQFDTHDPASIENMRKYLELKIKSEPI